MVIRFGGRNASAKFGLNFVRTNTLIRDSDGRGRDEEFSSASHRVAGGGRPPPVPTDRGVRISRTTLFGSWLTAFTAICSSSFPWSADHQDTDRSPGATHESPVSCRQQTPWC